MRHVLMLTVDVRSESELVDTIHQVMEVPGVTEWSADVLSPQVHQQLADLGHEITHHKRARSWTAVAKTSVR